MRELHPFTNYELKQILPALQKQGKRPVTRASVVFWLELSNELCSPTDSTAIMLLELQGPKSEALSPHPHPKPAPLPSHRDCVDP